MTSGDRGHGGLVEPKTEAFRDFYHAHRAIGVDFHLQLHQALDIGPFGTFGVIAAAFALALGQTGQAEDGYDKVGCGGAGIGGNGA